ncbi:hypothetical protein MTLP_04630 [Candidatus Methanoliparum sp. LAM-1]|nr:hypothetical protein [Candidatus Methanoliparum sp. LAM-1]BDC35781.1 hypothetical protein MTLP_04630 [Candidatus Methanoliparum sp. LAM-1]
MVEKRKLSVFEKYLTLWVLLCIGAGIFLRKIAPEVAVKLDSLSIMYRSPLLSVYFYDVSNHGEDRFCRSSKTTKTPKPVALTLFINWAIKPFIMYLITSFFLGHLFNGFLPGTEIIKTG